MAVDVAVAVEVGTERERFEALIDKILPIAKTADAIASRTVGKIRNVALLGSVSAASLAYACANALDWGVAAAISMLIPLLIPSLVLWKMHATLKDAVGLPQRLIATSDRLFGKVAEYRQRYAERQGKPEERSKAKFRHLWRTARELLELKTLGAEGRELLETMAGAVVMANPIFGITMFVAMMLCSGLVGVAVIIGFVFLL